MNILQRNDQVQKAETEKKLIKFESSIGRHMFGPIPEGHERDFFCLDPYNWIWNEAWKDETGNRVTLMTRYTIQPTGGVIKSQNGNTHRLVDDQEATNLYFAIKKYVAEVYSEYNQMLAAA